MLTVLILLRNKGRQRSWAHVREKLLAMILSVGGVPREGSLNAALFAPKCAQSWVADDGFRCTKHFLH